MCTSLYESQGGDKRYFQCSSLHFYFTFHTTKANAPPRRSTAEASGNIVKHLSLPRVSFLTPYPSPPPHPPREQNTSQSPVTETAHTHEVFHGLCSSCSCECRKSSRRTTRPAPSAYKYRWSQRWIRVFRYRWTCVYHGDCPQVQRAQAGPQKPVG